MRMEISIELSDLQRESGGQEGQGKQESKNSLAKITSLSRRRRSSSSLLALFPDVQARVDAVVPEKLRKAKDPALVLFGRPRVRDESARARIAHHRLGARETERLRVLERGGAWGLGRLFLLYTTTIKSCKKRRRLGCTLAFFATEASEDALGDSTDFSPSLRFRCLFFSFLSSRLSGDGTG